MLWCDPSSRFDLCCSSEQKPRQKQQKQANAIDLKEKLKWKELGDDS